MNAIRTPPAVALATQDANDALAAAGRAELWVPAAEADVSAAQKKVETASAKVTLLQGQLATLKKAAPPDESAIRGKEMELELASSALAAAGTQLDKAQKKADKVIERANGAQAKALQLEKKANVLARVNQLPEPFKGALEQDSLLDAASLSTSEQKRLLGGVSHFTKKQALDRDVKFITAATSADPENGLKLLTDNLKSGDPAYNKQLLTAVGPAVDKMMARMALSPADAQAIRMARTLMATASNLDPATRDALMAKLLAAGGGTLSVSATAALQELLEGGDGFRAASALVNLLPPDSPDADRIKRFEAEAIPKLREEFTKARAATEKLEGELGRLVVGFGPMLTGPQLEKAIDAFRAAHSEEFGKVEEAARKLSQAFEIEGQLTPNGKQGAKTVLDVISKGQQELTKELRGLMGDFEPWSRTAAGGNHLEQALQEEIDNGKPSWIATHSKLLKETKKGTEALARAVTGAIAARAASGNLREAGRIGALLKDHAGLLGLNPNSVKRLSDAFDKQHLPGGIDRMKKAIAEAEAGKFGVSNDGINTIKALGIGVGIFSAASNIGDWGKLDSKEKLKTVLDATRTGSDGAGFAATLMGKASVARTFSRLGGGLSLLSGGVETWKGVSQLSEGNWRDGVGNVSTGTGTMVLGLATVWSGVPGWGTAIGGALVVGGLLWKHTLGSDPMAKAEKAAEKDANAFLQGAGLPKEVVNTFDDLYQTDHRNVGFLLEAVAKELNMTPQALLEKLVKNNREHDGLLEDFVQMAKNVPVSPDFTFARYPRAGDDWDRAKVYGDVHYQNGDYLEVDTQWMGPKSLKNAIEWMRDNHALD